MLKKSGYIYLIRAVDTSRYKIGLTTRTPGERLAELNSSQSPYPLELIDYISVNDVHAAEKYYHQKYQSDRKHGEWFEFDSRKLRSIASEFRNHRKPPKPLVSLKTFMLALGLVLLLIQCHYSHNENRNRPLKHEKQNFQ
ncbi:MAG: GIY-YIG nuclease family protein [Tolypothrix brevis GSE-NOS-MK-07-07A]|jgi:hypothetical protein|nr:GIY-YIG nuclease family protein [Tolypothrix brevis GSE-NOS-MK-07-07A]